MRKTDCYEHTRAIVNEQIMKNRNLEHKDDWATPSDLYNSLDEEFGFDFDPCPYQHSMSWDGLQVEWGKRNYINPPYSLKLKELFVRKAIEESKKGKNYVFCCYLSQPVLNYFMNGSYQMQMRFDLLKVE